LSASAELLVQLIALRGGSTNARMEGAMGAIAAVGGTVDY